MLQNAIGEQDVANAIPRMQGAGGSNRDDAPRLNCQGDSDGNHRGDLADAAAQQRNWVSVDATDEQGAIGKTRKWVSDQIGGKRLKGGALFAERGGDERWA
jgi:hypothetical protein